MSVRFTSYYRPATESDRKVALRKLAVYGPCSVCFLVATSYVADDQLWVPLLLALALSCLAIDGFIVLVNGKIECGRDAVGPWPKPSFADYLITVSPSPMLGMVYFCVAILPLILLLGLCVLMLGYGAWVLGSKFLRSF